MAKKKKKKRALKFSDLWKGERNNSATFLICIRFFLTSVCERSITFIWFITKYATHLWVRSTFFMRIAKRWILYVCMRWLIYSKRAVSLIKSLVLYPGWSVGGGCHSMLSPQQTYGPFQAHTSTKYLSLDSTRLISMLALPSSTGGIFVTPTRRAGVVIFQLNSLDFCY